MKKQQQIQLIKVLLTVIGIVFLISLQTVVAQPGLPGPPGQTPIDGGLGILAALGGSYAIKKLRDRKQQQGDQL